MSSSKISVLSASNSVTVEIVEKGNIQKEQGIMEKRYRSSFIDSVGKGTLCANKEKKEESGGNRGDNY